MVVRFTTLYLSMKSVLIKLWFWIPLMSTQGVFNATLCDEVCQWLATGRWFSPGTPVSSTNKTDRHDITEILLKVALKTKSLLPWYRHFYVREQTTLRLKEFFFLNTSRGDRIWDVVIDNKWPLPSSYWLMRLMFVVTISWGIINVIAHPINKHDRLLRTPT